MKENDMSVSFFRGRRENYPIAQLEAIRANLRKEKALYRIFFRGPRLTRADGSPATSTLKADAVGFVVYRY